MKRTTKKLKIDRESIRQLSNATLGKVAGGVSQDDTCDICDPSIARNCVTK